MIRLDLLYLPFPYLTCWCLIFRSCKKQQYILINPKLTLRLHCLFSTNIAFAFDFFVCKRRYCNLSYGILFDVLLFYLKIYDLGIISIILLLFDKRILKTMSLDIFSTENQMVFSDFSRCFLFPRKNLKGLKRGKNYIYLIFSIFWKFFIPFRLFFEFLNR